MIVGIGLDIVDINRIKTAYEKNKRFAEKMLTPNELALFEKMGQHRKIEFLAGRYAAKEAFSKALGTGIGVVSFLDIDILPDEKNRPIVKSKHFEQAIFLSISHTETVAVAQVILEA